MIFSCIKFSLDVSQVVAVVSCVIAAWNVWLTRKIEQEHRRPCISLTPKTEDHGLSGVISLKNVGGSSAYNIRLETEPHIPDCTVYNGIQILPLDSRCEFGVGFLAELQEGNPSLQYKGAISYKDSVGKKYKEDVIIDFSVLKNSSVGVQN